MKLKIILLWIFSFIFTVAIAYYQRITGPTYPISGKVEFAGQTIKYKLIRTHGGKDDAEMDTMITKVLQRDGADLKGYLPHQPPAGKLMYQVTLMDGKDHVVLNKEPTVIRFKGDVPAWILIPHILIMFIAMMMSTRTGMEALAKGGKTYKYAWITLVALFVGGMILGPIVQKYAFGEFWTGLPYGYDLTDNKTLIALVFWVLAVWRLFRKSENRTWPVVAMVVLLLVYMIPHSMFGSTLDYSSGTVMTGK